MQQEFQLPSPLNYQQVFNQSQSDQVNADMMHQDRINNILSQINPEGLLTDTEHRLRRMRKDYFTGKWIPIDVNAKPVSPYLVANMISYLSGFLTNNVTFSNYTEREINNIMKLGIGDVIEDLTANQVLYEIENDYSERNRVSQIMFTAMFSVLKRALKGSEAAKFWRSVTISGDIHGDGMQQPQKKRLGDYLKFW